MLSFFQPTDRTEIENPAEAGLGDRLGENRVKLHSTCSVRDSGANRISWWLFTCLRKNRKGPIFGWMSRSTF